MSVQAPRRLFTVDEFYQMAEAGIFTEDDRVELLAGEVVQMTPIGSHHASCVSRLAHILWQHLSGSSIVRVQDPLRLDDYSEPQPDIVVAKARPDFYRHAHPTPADVLLVIEVAETSADTDRSEKVPLYGRSGVPEIWVVDLNTSRIDVYRGPTSEGYGEHLTIGRGESLQLAVIPGVEISADAALL